jgi:hypothetical protein
MQRKLADLDSMTGILEAVAPEIDERAERESVKQVMLDLELDYPESDRDPRERLPYVRQIIAANRRSSAQVRTAHGPVQVSRIGNGYWVDAKDSMAVRDLFMSKNPSLQLGVSAPPLDATTRTLFAGRGR